MSTVGFLVFLAVLLVPVLAKAQVGRVDHDWRLHLGSRSCGLVQVTYPGPPTQSNIYTFIYCGKRDYRVHTRAAFLLPALLVPLGMVGTLLLTRRGGKARTE